MVKNGHIPRAAAVDEQDILSNPAYIDDLKRLASQQHRDCQEVQDYAKQCLQEMAAEPRDRYLYWFNKLANFISTRSYQPQLDINTDQLEKLKALSATHPIVFLWSHKSHLDGFVFMRSLYAQNFRPQPLSFAGANMNFAGFGSLVKRSGGVFMRRSFNDDDVYKLVFKHYIDYLVAKKIPLSWSIEGTRSRTGKLMPPKMGLISWVLGSYHRAHSEKVLLAPVSISFDQIAEIDDYIAIQHGLPKRKESALWFLSYIFGMKKKVGKIYLRFAEPVSLANEAQVPDSMFPADLESEKKHVDKLVFEVCRRIEHMTPISATNLTALVLLSANNRPLSHKEIVEHANGITAVIKRRKLPTTQELDTDFTTHLQATLTMLRDSELVSCQGQDKLARYIITPNKVLAATYYRNTIVHYFIDAAMAELALASMPKNVGNAEQIFWHKLWNLRDLFKFEFFYVTKPEFKLGVSNYLAFRYPSRLTAMQQKQFSAHVLLQHHTPLFGSGILRSFVEAYQIVAQTLLAAEHNALNDHAAVANTCLQTGNTMLAQKEINTGSALSKSIYTNALKLAEQRGLLSGEPHQLAENRHQFSIEMQRWLQSVNQLQSFYDQAA